jgi:hypothetical protein
MTKFYKQTISLCFLLATILYSVALRAQTPTYAKNGGATNNSTFAWGGGTSSKKVQLLYLPSDFAPAAPASGSITKLYFMYGSSGNTASTDYVNLNISLGQTTNTGFSPATTFYTGLATVFSGSYSVPAGTAGTWFEVPLQTNFPYDNTKTLIVEISYESFTNTANSTGLGTFGGTAVTGRKLYASTTTATTGSTNTTLQNMGFDLLLPACTAPPEAGVATASVTGACPNVNFTLALTGNSVGSGQTYQWQSSTNNTSWSDIATATSPFSFVNQTVDQYYRAVVSCSGQNDTTNVVFVSTYQPMSGVYTINSANPVSSTNFQNFQELATRLNCAGVTGPVTINVQPGTYTGRFVLNTIPAVTSGNNIVINGNGQTLTYNATASVDRAAISFTGTQYVTINNLKVDVSGGTYGWGIFLTSNAHNNTFTNNTIMSDIAGSPSSDYAGIVASGSATAAATSGDNANNTTITGNTIKGGFYGIVLNGNGTTLATGNVIANNIIQDFGQDGIYINEQNGAQVINNNISRPTRSLLNLFRGIYLTGSTSQNNLVKNNRLHDVNTGNPSYVGSVYGMYVSSVDAPAGNENLFVNNMLYKFNGEGTQYGVYESGSNGSYFYHNTIVMDDQNAKDGDSRALYQTTTASNVQFKDNLVYVTRSGSGTKVGMFFNSTGSTIVSENNLIYVKPAAGYYVGSWGSSAGALQATPAAWQSVNGGAFDQFSKFADPLFANAAADNYTPTNSGVNDIGAYVSVAEDINGAPRSIVSPDAGAIEWTPAVNDAAIGGFVAPATVPYCGNTIPAIFTLFNAGTAVLNSVTINWSVNGAPQTAVVLNSLNLAPGASTNITLGNPSVAGNVVYTFSATASLPNNVADENSLNNTFTFSNWRVSLSGAYTINKNVAATGTNFTSIQGFVDALKTIGICGPITANVTSATGPYTEQVLIATIPGSSAVNRVTINGNGNALQFTPTITDKYVLQVKAANYITIENFIITSLSATYGYGINILDGSSFVAIRNNTVNVSLTETSATNAMGITTSGSTSYLNGTAPSDSLTIVGNTVNGGGVGIQIVGNFAIATRHTNVVVKDNVVNDSYTEGIQFLGVNNSLISGNNISRMNRTNSGTFTAVYMWNGNENFLLEKNKIHDIVNAGMTGTINGIGIALVGNATYTASGKMVNNIIYNIKNSGYQYGISANTSAAAAIDIFHNTVVLDDVASASTAATYPMYWSTSSLSTVPLNVKNNIFYVSRGGTGTKVLEYVGLAGNLSMLRADYNVLYFGTTTGTRYFGKAGSTNYATLADWQTAGNDLASVDADPMFVASATGNLTPANAAISGSTLHTQTVGVADDILGTTRSSTPDPGAYEFSAALPVSITHFSGSRQAAINKLTWTTATEINNAGFELQRSADGRSFSKLYFMVSKAGNGGSNSLLQYNYDDVKPFAGNSYYRLKQVDKDGKSQLSNVVVIKGAKPTSLAISSAYPNPAVQQLNLVITSPIATAVLVVITDVAGKIILQQPVTIADGDTPVAINVSKLSAGTYSAKLICNNECPPAAVQFVKQ